MNIKPGMILTFKKPVVTRGLIRKSKELKMPLCYQLGDTLQMIRRTNENPWGDNDLAGVHWVVRCSYFNYPEPESIWLEAAIKLLIANNTLTLEQE